MTPVINEILQDVGGGQPNSIVALTEGVFGNQQIGVTGPSGTIPDSKGKMYGIVYDEDQDGVLDPEDAVFPDSFSVKVIPPVRHLLSVIIDKAAHRGRATTLAEAHKDASKLLLEIREGDFSQIALLDINRAGSQNLLAWMHAIRSEEGLAADPPDPNFHQLGPLAAIGAVERLDSDPLANAILDVDESLRFESAISEALLHSLERYQGADAAGDVEWALIHGRAISDNVAQFRNQLGQTRAALISLRDIVLSDPRDLDGAFPARRR